MEICICVSRKNTKVLSPSLIASDAVAPLFLLTLDSKTLRSLVFTLSFLAFPPNSFVGFFSPLPFEYFLRVLSVIQ